ncbi:MAG: hemolysin family protein [Oscillospiraceae bacterium]|jgi:putative hemolysin|nr:hemolysin family protein [Oscillospiraceae bacterium]
MQPDPDPGSTILAGASDGTVLPQLLLLLLLILCNAFFAMSEIAVVTFNDNKLKAYAAAGNRKARRLLKLLKDKGKFLSMIQIGVTLAGFLASGAAAQSFVSRLDRVLAPLLPDNWEGVVSGASMVIITIIVSFFSLVLGEIVPKRIGMRNPEKISFRIVNVLRFFSGLFKPLVAAVNGTSNVILRLLRIDPNAEENHVTEEEIRMMVDIGVERGVLEDGQGEIIANVFDIDDTPVTEVMTHRTQIVGVDKEETVGDIVRLAMEEGVSRLPVYEEDMDTILGIVYVKDLLKYIGKNLPADLKPADVMRDVYYVPETMGCLSLFTEFTKRKTQIAIVKDEYGGTSGLITLEDVLEEFVGEIQDEYDNEEEDVSPIDETHLLLDGTTDVDEVGERTKTALPEGDFDTVAGFIINELGYIPKPDEHPVVRHGNLLFTVKEMEEQRIAEVEVEILPPPPSAEAEEAEEEE